MTKPVEDLHDVTAEIIEEVGEENVLAFVVVIVHKGGWTGHSGIDNYPQAAECCEALDTVLEDLKTKWGLNMGQAQGTA